jgi:hypothetical protein
MLGDEPPSTRRRVSVRLRNGAAALWAKDGGGWTAYFSERAFLTEAEASALIRSLGVDSGNARIVPEGARG